MSGETFLRQESLADSQTSEFHLQPSTHVPFWLEQSSTSTYHLEVVQEPEKTAEYAGSSLSRLPLSPPIIARLTVKDSAGNSIVPEAELPFLVAHLSLLSDDGSTALDGGSAQPFLYGTLVSSIEYLKDLQGKSGLFFLFPDVSIRWRGRFQLGITVVRISSIDNFGKTSIAEEGIIVAGTRTQTFDVLPYREYTAVPTTPLTNSFSLQGARFFSS